MNLNFKSNSNSKFLDIPTENTFKSLNSGDSSEVETETINESRNTKIQGKRRKDYKKSDSLKSTVNTESEKKKYNNWTPAEDLILLELCSSKFQQKWKKISSILGNKTPRMCAYRIRKLKKFVKFNNEKNKKKIFGFQNENEELNRIKIPDIMIKNEIKNNGFINFKKMRKKRTFKQRKNSSSLPVKQTKTQTKIQEKPSQELQSAINNFKNLKLGEEVSKFDEIFGLESQDSDKSNKRPTQLTIKEVNMAPINENQYLLNTKNSFEKLSSNSSILFTFSRNSSNHDIILDSFNRGDFKSAFEKVFNSSYLKQASNDTILSKGIFNEMLEKERKNDDFERNDNILNLESLNNEKNEDKIEVYLQMIEGVINNPKIDNLDKKRRLDELYEEINELSRFASSQLEVKKFLNCKSKILQGRVMLTAPVKLNSKIIELNDSNIILNNDTSFG